MKPEFILQADILDIIFENRNKEYGAYNLRKDYNKRMMQAMSGVGLLVGGLWLMNYLKQSNNNFSSAIPAYTTDTVTLSPLPALEPPVPPVPPREKIATIKNSTFVLSNNVITDTLPSFEEFNKDVIIGVRTEHGETLISNISPPEEPKGNNTESIHAEVPLDTDKIFDRAESMPEFPGGQAAFIRFLSKNLKVPEEGLQPGQKIKMLIRFVVGRAGDLSNIEFIETGGEVFEQEVKRVLNKMPRWKPGRQNGQNVSIYFKLPVVFEAPDE